MSIPQVIHRIWVGGPMPAHLQGYGETWRMLHGAGWTHKLWGDDEIRALGLVNQRIYDEAERIAPGSEGQLRADVARYEILLRLGGLYVDTDMECRKPFDPLMEGGAFAAWETPNKWVNNAVLGAEPGDFFMSRLVERLDERVRAYQGPRVRPNVLSGPQYLTSLYKSYRTTLRVFPKDWFYPYLWNELHRGVESFPDAYAIHHWDNMRKKKGQPR